MTAAVFSYIWEYRVRADTEAEFLQHYRPDGTWARLFGRAPGYLGTQLLHDLNEPGRYVTVDRWETEAAFRSFRERFAKEFEELDRRCEALTVHERSLGRYVEILRDRQDL